MVNRRGQLSFQRPKTASEKVAQNRNLPPEISSNAAKQVSDYRRAQLEEQIYQGQFREQGAVPANLQGYPKAAYETDDSGNTKLGVINYASGGKRAFATSASTAISSSGGASSGWRGSNDTSRQIPEVYSPLWLHSNLNLPRDRATVNAWSRAFFALNPFVHNAITLHSTYPISKLNIKCSDPKVEQFFAEMAEEIDLLDMCISIAQEFWTLGEAFVYAELGENAKWSRLHIQNPDYVSVQRSPIAGDPIISLRPDEQLKQVVMGTRPSDVQQRQQLSPSIIEHVKRGQNIPLDNFYVSHLARRIAPYEIRGTGLIVNCFRSIMRLDKINEAKFAQADNMVNPLTLVKVGGQDIKPTAQDLEQWRNVFEAATGDKDFKIFTHNEIDVQRVGYNQGILDTSGDFQQLMKEIFIGLMVPSVIMDGSDTTYATGSVSLDVLRQRYMSFREKLAKWLKRKIFAPISELNEFYEVKDGEKKLIVPDVEWNHMSLFDMSDYINNIMQLANQDAPQRKISLQTLYRSLGVDYDDELKKMRYEDIQATIRERELQSLREYSLSSLRALTPNDEIDEPIGTALESQDPYSEPVPGQEDGGGGMGGLGGGGLMPAPGGPPPAPIGGGVRGPKPPGSGGNPPPGNVGIGPGGTPKPPPPS